MIEKLKNNKMVVLVASIAAAALTALSTLFLLISNGDSRGFDTGTFFGGLVLLGLYLAFIVGIRKDNKIIILFSAGALLFRAALWLLSGPLSSFAALRGYNLPAATVMYWLSLIFAGICVVGALVLYVLKAFNISFSKQSLLIVCLLWVAALILLLSSILVLCTDGDGAYKASQCFDVLSLASVCFTFGMLSLSSAE